MRVGKEKEKNRHTSGLKKENKKTIRKGKKRNATCKKWTEKRKNSCIQHNTYEIKERKKENRERRENKSQRRGKTEVSLEKNINNKKEKRTTEN